MNDGPNQCLAQNLDRLLALKGLGRKEAAEAIGVPYKWLRKAVSQGMQLKFSINSVVLTIGRGALVALQYDEAVVQDHSSS
jgi:hypothetical protein